MSVASSARVHPTSIVEDGATIGENVRIGPFCMIGSRVTIGDNTEIMSHVVIEGHTTIGANARIFHKAVLGGEPQNVHYKGEDTELVIGANCVIREGVTMHIGMAAHGGKTTVGDNCLFLAYAHVAHDCHVGDNVILSNNVMLAGHVTIGDRVIMGGGAAIQQFSQVGHHAFIGGLSAVTADVIPYGMVNGGPAYLGGLNVVGMKRSGMDRAAIHAVRSAFRSIFLSEHTVAEGVAAVKAGGVPNEAVADIIAFIESDRKCGLTSPARSHKN
jgi:UDP-N-acetylglucosamine acyltransferase